MKIFNGYSDMRFGESKMNPLRRVRTNILLSSFSGDKEDIYRAVHFLRDNPFFFADYPRKFFHQTHLLLEQGKIKEVRRLLVYSNDDELYSEQSQRIIRFHSKNAEYSYRLFGIADYSNLRQEHQIPPRVDFGVFGEKRVYRARIDRPDFVIGTWTSHKHEIKKFIQFFEACWNSPCASRNPLLEEGPRISIDEFFTT